MSNLLPAESSSEARVLALLAEQSIKDFEITRDRFAQDAASQIDEINKDPSMSRRNKRSRYFRIRKNFETVAACAATTHFRVYGVLRAPEAFLTTMKIPDFLISEDVVIHQEPVIKPDYNLISSIPLPEDSDLTGCDLDRAELLPCAGFEYVPVTLQPLVPITRKIYDDLSSTRQLKIGKCLSYTSYLQLCVLQTYEYIQKFGLGVVKLSDTHPGFSRSVEIGNFEEIVRFQRTLRPCTIKGKTYIGVLPYDELHWYYNRMAKSTVSAYLDGYGTVASISTSPTRYDDDVIRFQSVLRNVDRLRLRGVSLPKTCRPISDGSFGISYGDESVLNHLIVYLRRNVERSSSQYEGECPHYTSGVFYDPSYGISYLTSSLSVILSKLKDEYER